MCTPKGLLITNHSFCHDRIVQSFEKTQRKLTSGSKSPREAIHDASVVVLHPLQLPAGRDLTGPHITEGITWINTSMQG
jgi:hypothetical protein